MRGLLVLAIGVAVCFSAAAQSGYVVTVGGESHFVSTAAIDPSLYVLTNARVEDFSGGTGTSLSGTGYGSGGIGDGAPLRLDDPATTANRFDIAYKNGSGGSETITHVFAPKSPQVGTALYGSGTFGGTALWLAGNLFQKGMAPPQGFDSDPETGTWWNGSVGPASAGAAFRGNQGAGFSIPVPTGETLTTT